MSRTGGTRKALIRGFGTLSGQKGSARWLASLDSDDESSRRDRIAAMQIQLHQARQDAEYFVLDSGLAKTWDTADTTGQPYKTLPNHKDYLRYMIRWWCLHEKCAFAKSRDMIATLTVCLLHLWALIFEDGNETVCLSDKEAKACKNVDRMWTSYDLLPDEAKEMIPTRRLMGKDGLTRIIEFKTRPPLFPGDSPFRGSVVAALGQGARQIETWHPKRIFFDQVESTVKLKETLASIMPIVKPGVGLTLVGTPHPGEWERIVHDRQERAVEVLKAA